MQVLIGWAVDSRRAPAPVEGPATAAPEEGPATAAAGVGLAAEPFGLLEVEVLARLVGGGDVEEQPAPGASGWGSFGKKTHGAAECSTGEVCVSLVAELVGGSGGTGASRGVVCVPTDEEVEDLDGWAVWSAAGSFGRCDASGCGEVGGLGDDILVGGLR